MSIKTLATPEGVAVAIGEIASMADGHHVNGEVWPSGFHIHNSIAQAIGAVWENSAWVYRPPPQPREVPSSVTMRSARLGLYSAGLLKAVEEFIASMEGPQGDLARIDWATAQTVQRRSPLVDYMTNVLGKTSDEIDSLFIDAARIEAAS